MKKENRGKETKGRKNTGGVSGERTERGDDWEKGGSDQRKLTKRDK